MKSSKSTRPHIEGKGARTDRLRTVTRYLVAAFFIGVGAHHFIEPALYEHIMPPYLPAHRFLVLLSGAFEILGGIGVLLNRSRQFAGWGLVALLVAVYPANIHMLVNEVYLPGMTPNKAILWARMPLQFLFMAAVIWSCRLIHPTPQLPSDNVEAN